MPDPRRHHVRETGQAQGAHVLAVVMMCMATTFPPLLLFLVLPLASGFSGAVNLQDLGGVDASHLLHGGMSFRAKGFAFDSLEAFVIPLKKHN